MSLSRRGFLSGSVALPLFAAKKPAEHPNIVLLLAEAVPAWMIGCYGNREVKTPNIDHLAQIGTRFATHIVCTPAPVPGRNTLLTGRTPMQLGGGEALGPAEVTLDKLLGGAGYACQAAAGAAALQAIEAQTAGKPFFLTVNLTPFQPPYSGAPQKYVDRYAKAPFESFSKEQPAPNARAGREMLAEMGANQRRAAAALGALDDEVQAVVSKLYDRRLMDQTVVVFTSTCGSLLGRHGLWDAGLASDPPNMYEESVATPLIWSWAGHIPTQLARPEVVSSYDLLPTIADLVSAPLPARNLCGRSYLLPATGKPLPNKQRWPATVFGRLQNTEMARMDRYKLVLRDQGKGANELYDLTADRGERTNRYDDEQFVTVRNGLMAELAAWRRSYSA